MKHTVIICPRCKSKNWKMPSITSLEAEFWTMGNYFAGAGVYIY